MSDSDDESEVENTENLSAMEDAANTNHNNYEIENMDPNDIDTLEVSLPLLKSVIKESGKGSVAALRKVVSIFKTACTPSTQKLGNDDFEENANGRKTTKELKSKYRISDAEIYEKIMIDSLDHIHTALYRHFGLPNILQAEHVENIGEHREWRKLEPIITAFLKSFLFALSSISSSPNQSQASVYLLTSLEPYMIFLHPLPKFWKTLLKILLKIWSFPSVDHERTNDSAGYAFLRIRQLALQTSGIATEECMRSMYLTYAKCCGNYSELTQPVIAFMENCIIELYGLDIPQAYQQAFLYIRQLALHVRAALMKKDAESVRVVTNWQFVNCCRLWTRVLSSLRDRDSLGPLIYPLTQVMTGVMNVATSYYYVPLKFHLISYLQQLASWTQHFVPTASKLLEIIEHPDLMSRPTPSTDSSPRLQYLVKFPANSVTTPAVRDAIVQEAVTLLRLDAEIYRYHVAYPEYTYLTLKKLKGFAKRCKVHRWKDLCRALCSQIEQTAATVKKARVALRQSPMEITAFEPLQGPTDPDAKARWCRLAQGRFSGLSVGLRSSAEANGGIAGGKGKNLPSESHGVTASVATGVGEKEATTATTVAVPRTKGVKTASTTAGATGRNGSMAEPETMNHVDEVSAFQWSDDDEGDVDE